MRAIIYKILCRLAAKIRPDLVRTTSADGRETRCLLFTYPEARIDFEMAKAARLRFVVENPMRFDPQTVSAAKQELQFRTDFQKETEISMVLTDHLSIRIDSRERDEK